MASRWCGGYTATWRLCPRRLSASSPTSARLRADLIDPRFTLSSRACYVRRRARPLPVGVHLSSRVRSSRTEPVSRPVQQDRAHLMAGAAEQISSRDRYGRTGRWRPVLAGLLGLVTGGRPRIRRAAPFSRLFGWVSGVSRVRWCQGPGCWGGGLGGGSAVLMDRARGSVLPGDDGLVMALWAAW